ncbi:MAG TPA: hypothetical protein VLE74_02930 [Candidatus Saccharimonadales bacterium]|nr:hypothetical protein [Candidatus Saccharimonadales bacterium]
MTRLGRFSSRLIGGLLVISIPLTVFWQRWNIYDSWRLRNYQAPVAIAQLATDDTMTDKTRRLFYVSHPELEDKQTFSGNCKSTEKTIVLGCYILWKGIYLYNVTDARLAGVVQVTAAHETLHAAYDRLSPTERTRVNKLINQAYGQVTDQRIKDTIEDYRKNGADTTNELHSILGTEVRNLPPELEQYYAQYFKDRKAIVGYSEKYEAVFSSNKAQAAAFLEQMNAIKAQLDALKSSIDSQEAQLSSQRAALQADRNSANTPAGVQAYNARVDAYNAQVRTYQQSIASYNALVKRYNDILAQYNAVASEEGELIKALDSRPTNVQTQ